MVFLKPTLTGLVWDLAKVSVTLGRAIPGLAGSDLMENTLSFSAPMPRAQSILVLQNLGSDGTPPGR